MTTSDKVWQRVVQRVAMNGNEWYNEWERVVQRVTMSRTTSDNEWQWMTLKWLFWSIFFFSRGDY